MKIKIVHNLGKEWAARAAKAISRMLEAKGHRICRSGAGATVIIGGDGTVMHHKGEIEGILVGIGSKRSGICQLNRDEWETGLEQMLRSKPSEIHMLDIVINGKRHHALNDVAIRSPDFKAIHTRVSCGNFSQGFYGDGINVCSMIGSTGYNKSLLGPALLVEDAVAVTPIAPILQQPNAVVLPFSKITVSCLEKACCVIDGQHIAKIGKSIEIKKGRKILYGRR
jgi:NAD kinase